MTPDDIDAKVAALQLLLSEHDDREIAGLILRAFPAKFEIQPVGTAAATAHRFDEIKRKAEEYYYEIQGGYPPLHP